MNTGEREYTQGGQRKKFDQTNKWKFTSLESSIPPFALLSSELN